MPRWAFHPRNFPSPRWGVDPRSCGYTYSSDRDHRPYDTQESQRSNEYYCPHRKAGIGSYHDCEHCFENHHFDDSINLRTGDRASRRKRHLCWGCQHQCFDTIPEMLRHLEDGMCDAGWNIHHINALATECEGSKSYVVPRRLPWLLTRVPSHFTNESNYDQWKRQLVCPKCKRRFETKKRHDEHLRTCSEGYPYVLRCPECRTRRFFKIGELVQHMETSDCETVPNTPSRKNLIQGLKKKLRYPQDQQRLDIIRYELRSCVGRPDEVSVKDIELDGYERRR